MKNFTLTAIIACAALLCSCGGNDKNGDNKFPADFLNMSDAQRMAFVMAHATPDSVGRFVCDAALGRVPGARIDTLANAVLYAYTNYKDADLNTFSDEFERYTEALPLGDKMKIYMLSGQEDADRVGLTLGLEYVGRIRDKKLNVKQIDEELAAFKTACAEDSATDERFMRGFETALKYDEGKDISPEVYKHFMGDNK